MSPAGHFGRQSARARPPAPPTPYNRTSMGGQPRFAARIGVRARAKEAVVGLSAVLFRPGLEQFARRGGNTQTASGNLGRGRGAAPSPKNGDWCDKGPPVKANHRRDFLLNCTADRMAVCSFCSGDWPEPRISWESGRSRGGFAAKCVPTQWRRHPFSYLPFARKRSSGLSARAIVVGA